jgi:hypothetical protein
MSGEIINAQKQCKNHCIHFSIKSTLCYWSATIERSWMSELVARLSGDRK